MKLDFDAHKLTAVLMAETDAEFEFISTIAGTKTVLLDGFLSRRLKDHSEIYAMRLALDNYDTRALRAELAGEIWSAIRPLIGPCEPKAECVKPAARGADAMPSRGVEAPSPAAAALLARADRLAADEGLRDHARAIWKGFAMGIRALQSGMGDRVAAKASAQKSQHLAERARAAFTDDIKTHASAGEAKRSGAVSGNVSDHDVAALKRRRVLQVKDSVLAVVVPEDSEHAGAGIDCNDGASRHGDSPSSASCAGTVSHGPTAATMLEATALATAHAAREQLLAAVAQFEAAGFGSHVTQPLRDALDLLRYSVKEVQS